MSTRQPLIIAHRGGSPSDIDNSRDAFAHAVQVGVDMLECDLRQTRDGALVLIHDAVGVVDGRRIVVYDTDLEDLRRVFPWLMTLDEYLEEFGRRLPFNLDLKTHGYELPALRALERHGTVEQALISTVHSHSLWRLSRAEPRAGLSLSRGHLASHLTSPLAVRWLRRAVFATLPGLLWLSGARAVGLPHELVDRSLVDRLHRRGYQVFTWTVDDEHVARRLIAAGVDAMATNDPAKMLVSLGLGSVDERQINAVQPAADQPSQ